MQNDDFDRSLAGGSAFDAHYGLEATEFGDGFARGRVVVTPEIKQPTGIVHGGVYASIAEALASGGTNWAVSSNGEVGLGLSNNTSFLRSVSDGVLEAEATAVHRGRTIWLWDVQISDEEGRVCAVSRITIAVRPRRDI